MPACDTHTGWCFAAALVALGGLRGCIASIQMTTLMKSVNISAQARVGLSALKMDLKPARGALLRLSVLGKRQFLAANWIVASLLTSLLATTLCLIIWMVSGLA